MHQRGFVFPIILVIFLVALVAFILGNTSPKLSLFNRPIEQQSKSIPLPKGDKFSSVSDVDPILEPYLSQKIKLWYQDEYSIYNGNLDGTNPVKIVEGSQFDQLNAISLSKDGNTIYYITVSAQNKVVIFKKNITEGKSEKLLEVEKDSLSGFYYHDFSISNNEKSIAYTDKEGLWVYSLVDHSKKLLLKNKSFSGSLGGFSFTFPLWSYDDSLIAVEKALWEGAEDLIINADTGKILVEGLLPGKKNWDYSQNRLLLAAYSYNQGGLFLVKDKPVDLLEKNLDYSNQPIVNAQISQNGKIIFLSSGNIGLFNTKDSTFKTLFKGISDTNFDFLWLPNDKYVYFRSETGDVWFFRLDSNSLTNKVKLPIHADRLITISESK